MLSSRMRLAIPAILALALTGQANADIIFFTDQAAFDAAATTNLVETFEAVTPKDTPLSSFTSNGITYTGLAGQPSPNVFVASPGFTSFGVPVTTSSVLTANGDEDFTLTFASPSTAVGFDTYLNSFGPATIRVFGSGGLLGAFTLSHDPATIGFLGFVASEAIASVRWTTVNGRVIDTGIDNVRVGSAVVPEPGSWVLAGLGLAGLAGYAGWRRACRMTGITPSLGVDVVGGT